jgi:hypothetical protein
MLDLEEMMIANITLEITKSIGKFDSKYGGSKNFEKQKFLHDLFISKIPNSGYEKIATSKLFDELIIQMPENLKNGNIDYESEYLNSWLTDLPNLHVVAAEQFYQLNKPCWFVVYQYIGVSTAFTTTVKYWEDRRPQVFTLRNSFG